MPVQAECTEVGEAVMKSNSPCLLAEFTSVMK